MLFRLGLPILGWIALCGCGHAPLAGSATGRVPVNQVRVHGLFTFVSGNPFPGGKLPLFHIVQTGAGAEGASRDPSVQIYGTDPPSFSVLLEKGHVYDFNWVYRFGTEQRFFHWHTPVAAEEEFQLVLLVDRDGQAVAGRQVVFSP